MSFAPLLLATLAGAAGVAAAQDPAPGSPPPAPAPKAPETVPVSAFTMPLYLGDEPPEVRSLRMIQIVHTDVPNVRKDVTRTHEEALALGQHIASLLRIGEDFDELSREYSATENAQSGGVMGSFPPGLLAGPMDAFLFSAEIGDVSDPIDMPSGVAVAERIETYAATRHIFISGNGEEQRKRAQALYDRIAAGEDFGQVALEESEDPYSRGRGGLFTLFERGPNDRLLKAAAFSARVGQVVGPIKSPSGWHLVERVPVEGHPRDLAEVTMIRPRVILISHDNTPLGAVTAPRPMNEAKRLAKEIHDRIQAGEDMAALAREYDDDPGGKARSGDLGWVHRGNPRNASFLAEMYRMEPGELLGPVLTSVGYVIARRER